MAAARWALHKALVDSPEEIHAIVEKRMLEDLLGSTVTPLMPTPALCSRAWVEHRSKISNYKTSAHAAWGAAGALDALLRGQVAEARARLGLLVLQLDQASIDKGSWHLAAELALEPPPPLATLARHSSKSHARRSTILQVVGSQVSRAGSCTSSRDGRLPTEAQDSAAHLHQSDQRRRQRTSGAQEKSKSQGKELPKENQ